MADLTSTSTITKKKTRRSASQKDTIGQIHTRTYTVALPNPANAGDFVVIDTFPAGCSLMGVWHKANAAIAANTGIEYGVSATANGASPTVLVANVATGGITTNYTYAAPSTAANAVVPTSADGYLVATVRGNSTVATHTLTITAVVLPLDPDSAPYSTFTL